MIRDKIGPVAAFKTAIVIKNFQKLDLVRFSEEL